MGQESAEESGQERDASDVKSDGNIPQSETNGDARAPSGDANRQVQSTRSGTAVSGSSVQRATNSMGASTPAGRSYADYDAGPNHQALSARYGLDFCKRGQAEKVQRLENEFGSDRVSRWADEGMTVEAMGKPRDMQAFRERQEGRSERIPADIERQNQASLQRNRDADQDGGPAGDVSAPDAVRRVISSPGTSMDETVQREMESKMGGDFSDVQLHTGPDAEAAAESINARAFTVGNHVAFNSGEYQPESNSGKKLLAHELTHVRQQTDGRVSLLPKSDSDHHGAGMHVGEGVHVQPKLEVSSPDDPAEKEAERMAEKVMKMDGSDSDEATLKEEANRSDVHGKACTCGRCGTIRPSRSSVQPTGETGGTVEDETESTVRAGVSGSGKPLPSNIREQFESSIGADFSDVQVHTGSEANEGAQSITAEAYTLGSDIAFAKGAYDPDSNSGKKLLAHELTHVAQQEGEGRASAVFRSSASDHDHSGETIRRGPLTDNYENKLISHEINLNNSTVRKGNMYKDIFTGHRVSIARTDFEGSNAFQSAQIDNSVRGGPNIEGDRVFHRSNISGGVNLGRATIEGDWAFRRAEISADVNLNGATIEDENAFRGASISGDVNLSGSTIEGDNAFRSAVISGDVDLHGSAIDGEGFWLDFSEPTGEDNGNNIASPVEMSQLVADDPEQARERLDESMEGMTSRILLRGYVAYVRELYDLEEEFEDIPNYEMKRLIIEHKFGIDVEENIELVDQTMVTEVNSFEELREERENMTNQTLDIIFDRLLLMEDLLDDAEFETVTLFSDPGEENEDGNRVYTAGTYSSNNEELRLNALFSDNLANGSTTLHEMGHSVDRPRANAEYSSRSDFRCISGWDEYDSADSALDAVKSAVSDPYRVIIDGTHISNGEEVVDPVAESLIDQTIRGGTIDQSWRAIKDTAPFLEDSVVVDEFDVMDEGDTAWLLGVHLIRAIMSAQAAESPYRESSYEILREYMDDDEIVHQGYRGLPWLKYDESARSDMLDLRADGYASRDPGEEFAEVFAKGFHPEMELPNGSGYETWFEAVFEGAIPDPELEGEVCGP